MVRVHRVGITLFVDFRLRDSRLGRAWVALRRTRSAAVAMGVPAVKTKLLAYASAPPWAASRAFLGSFLNRHQRQPVRVLLLDPDPGQMTILGGLGSIWGVVLGAVALSFINTWPVIREQINSVGEQLGLDFDATQVTLRDLWSFLLVR